MSWFSRKPTQMKYVKAAATVATNLYLHTIPGAEDAPAPLQFDLPDSRYRYLLFCFSAVVSAALVYDEKKHIQPEPMLDGCLQAARFIAGESPLDFFGPSANRQDSLNNTSAYFQEFLRNWSRWPALEKEGKHEERWNLISLMIRTTESDHAAAQSDMERLSRLALHVDCVLPTMWAAFQELANR